MMIFTIGHTESYLLYFERLHTPKKKGRCDNYSGGSVWKTKEEAQKHVGTDFSVFGVLADWDTQTEQSLDGDWHDLLIDADLVLLDSHYANN